MDFLSKISIMLMSASAGSPRRLGRHTLCVTLLIAAIAPSSGCAGLGTASPAPGPAGNQTAAPPAAADLSPYLATMDRIGPGDPDRQSAELTEARAAALQSPTPGNRLRYAIALGSAGHAASNPVEASQLISQLLDESSNLSPPEVTLARAYLREFDSRAALHADIERQRESYEQRFNSEGAEDSRRTAALSAENARLRKALTEAERKLSAVAEMERSLINNAGQPPPNDNQPEQ